jgi:hypothetical protein
VLEVPDGRSQLKNVVKLRRKAAGYERSRQFHLLWAHFFKRFLHNDLIAPEGETQITLVHILSVLTVPGFLFAYWFFQKYLAHLGSTPRTVREETIVEDQALLIAFSMLLIGFLAILEWDALLPEPRDFAVLTPLPIRRTTLLGAKVTALLLFLGFFTVAINLFSTLVFPLATVEPGASLGVVLWHIATHVVSLGAASAFVFFSCVTVHGFLLNISGRSLFGRVARTVQLLLLFLFVQVLFLLPRLPAVIETLRQGGSFGALLPPVWYMGLYQTLLGNQDPYFRSLARTGSIALILSLIGLLIVYVATFRRALSPWMGARESQSQGVPRAEAGFEALLSGILVRGGVERATFFFVIKTTLRSHKHRLYLGAYGAVGLALSGLTTLLSTRWLHAASSEQIESVLLPVPLIVSFFLLVGLRYIFTVPAELGAKWIFQLEAGYEPRQYLSGVCKAMLLLALAPLFIFLAPLYLIVSVWPQMLLHLAYCAMLALMLVEVLMFRFPKIPFTCSYLPGKANLRLYWAPYLFACLVYISTVISLESWLLEQPDRFLAFFLVSGGVLLLFRAYQDRWVTRRLEFIFDEEPEPAVRSLRLNS